MNSGTREWNCELSTVDTGLADDGNYLFKKLFNQNNETENEITMKYAAKLIRET